MTLSSIFFQFRKLLIIRYVQIYVFFVYSNCFEERYEMVDCDISYYFETFGYCKKVIIKLNRYFINNTSCSSSMPRKYCGQLAHSYLNRPVSCVLTNL